MTMSLSPFSAGYSLNFTLVMQDDSLNDVSYTIQVPQSQSAALTIYNTTGNLTYMLPFQDIGNHTQIVLGQNFLANFIVVFDNDKQKLGLGILQGSIGPWIKENLALAYAAVLIVIGVAMIVVLIVLLIKA
jgi:hypothetical protein